MRTESTSATASREGGDQPIAHAHCDPCDARVARTPNSLHEEAEHKRRSEDERDPPHGPPHGEKVPSHQNAEVDGVREPRKLRPSAYPPLGIIGTNNSRACRRCVAVSSAEPNRAVNGAQERGLAVSVPSHAVERRRPRGTRAVRPSPHSLSATRGSFRAGSLGDEGERAGDPRNFKPNRQAALVGAEGVFAAPPLSPATETVSRGP